MVGVATIQGRQRPRNADAAAHHWFPSLGTLAVAVVDGVGSATETATAMRSVADASVLYAARHDALSGIMMANGMLVDPTVEFPNPDGIMVLALSRPRQPIVVTYVGDCQAYEWVDGALHPLTEPHTKGARLRAEGVPDDEAAEFDNVPITSIARATPVTIGLAETFSQTVVLATDGVHRVLSSSGFTEIVRANLGDPEECARVLVTVAHDLGADDATAAVIHHTEPLRHPDSLEGR